MRTLDIYRLSRGRRPFRCFDDFDARVVELMAPSDPTADGRVQIMTMHKAKGLEVDVAVGADRGDDMHPLPRWLADRIARKRDNQVARLLDVAATRAIRKLHLVGHVKVGEDKDGVTIMKKPATSALLGVL